MRRNRRRGRNIKSGFAKSEGDPLWKKHPNIYLDEHASWSMGVGGLCVSADSEIRVGSAPALGLPESEGRRSHLRRTWVMLSLESGRSIGLNGV